MEHFYKLLNRTAPQDPPESAERGTAFLQMKNIWASPILNINIKNRKFNTTVKLVLLYGAQAWKTTAATLNKIQILIITYLRRIFRIRWAETISNRELWKRSKQQPTGDESSKDAEDGLDTPCEIKWPVSHVKPWPGTHRERERRPHKKHLAPWSGGWKKEGGLHLGITWEADTGSDCLESSCRQPVLQ